MDAAAELHADSRPMRIAFVLSLTVCLVACSGSDAPSDAATDAPHDGGAACATDPDCDDGMFCTGAEHCTAGVCTRTPACGAGEVCDEARDACRPPNCDEDGDGVMAIACGGDDCDDADPLRSSAATEVCDPAGRDEDCNPATYGARDSDHDGLDDAHCRNVIAGTVTSAGEDCDDARRSVHPGSPEVCNQLDDDCDGAVDEGVTVSGFTDADRDLHGDPAMPTTSCPGLAGFSTLDDDCDDTRITVHGGMGELCDAVDNDCDGRVDEAMVSVPWYDDGDGDAYGTPGITTVSCTPVAGASILPLDCAGTDGTRHPGARETCDGVDDDCNGLADYRLGINDWEDDDDDGFADAACGASIALPDCLDSDPDVHPGAPERCGNHLDDDCNGTIDDGCAGALDGGVIRDASVDAWVDAATCTADLASDPLNCGACDNRCRPRPFALPVCMAGLCGLACETGRDDCNRIESDGCETIITDDVLNCGGCNVHCGPGEVCVGTMCAVVPDPSAGTEGAFDPATDVVLDPGRHDFTTIHVRPGVTVRTRGDGWLDLRATGEIVIEGTIDVSGGAGGDGVSIGFFGAGGGGGVGSTVAGLAGSDSMCRPPGGGGLGTTGGDAAAPTNCGLGGNRAGGGSGGNYSGGGGGGGFAGGAGGGGTGAGGVGASYAGGTGGRTSGQGGDPTAGVYAGGDGPGGCGGGGGSIGLDAAMDLAVATTFRPGSSGGGGGGPNQASYTSGGTGGGGGGGGALRLSSPVQIVVAASARLLANGGRGGAASQFVCGGGGGSGGVVVLSSPVVDVQGSISALGGAGGTAGYPGGLPGAAGGLGRIRISTSPSRCRLDGSLRPPPIAGCDPATPTPGRTYVGVYPN